MAAPRQPRHGAAADYLTRRIIPARVVVVKETPCAARPMRKPMPPSKRAPVSVAPRPACISAPAPRVGASGCCGSRWRDDRDVARFSTGYEALLLSQGRCVSAARSVACVLDTIRDSCRPAARAPIRQWIGGAARMQHDPRASLDHPSLDCALRCRGAARRCRRTPVLAHRSFREFRQSPLFPCCRRWEQSTLKIDAGEVPRSSLFVSSCLRPRRNCR